MELSSRNNKIYGNVVLSVDLKSPFLYISSCNFPQRCHLAVDLRYLSCYSPKTKAKFVLNPNLFEIVKFLM